MGELKKVFRPELLNRIDEVIVFHKLTKDEIKIIVDLMMKRLKEQMGEHEAAIELTEDAKELLVTKGYDPAMGARPLRRAIQRYHRGPARGLRPRPLAQARLDHRRRQEGRRGRGRHLDRRGRGPAAEPEKVTVPPEEPSAEADGDEPARRRVALSGGQGGSSQLCPHAAGTVGGRSQVPAVADSALCR